MRVSVQTESGFTVSKTIISFNNSHCSDSRWILNGACTKKDYYWCILASISRAEGNTLWVQCVGKGGSRLSRAWLYKR